MRSDLFKNGSGYVPSDLPEDPADYVIFRAASAMAYERNYTACVGFALPRCDSEPLKVIEKARIELEIKFTQIKSPKRKSFDWLAVAPNESAIMVISHKENSIVTGRIWGVDEAAVMYYYDGFTKAFPEEKADYKPAAIPIKFWTATSEGPSSRIRKINALDWAEINVNYPTGVADRINDLMVLRPPIEGGKILLWHGPPGTGKSSAIRSLTQAWFPWCDAAYIVDPERFFGDAQYMMDVLLNTYSSDFDWDDFEEDDTEEDAEQRAKILKGEDRWRLLLLEDADEFIQADAKERTGQALSRLLNLGDGLIGSGLNFLTLITTNEKITNIHSAVSREGRSLANVKFDPFNRDQARAWFKAHTDSELDVSAHTEWSLAQLYNARRELKQQQIVTDKKDEAYGGIYL